MNYSIKGVDWTKYLDRKQPLILFAAFIRPYGALLEKVSGFRFKHQLHFYSGDSGTFYKSAKELKDAEAYFRTLVAHSDSQLTVWRDAGIEWNRKADELVAMPPEVNEHSFRGIYEVCESVMLYDTTIPYRVMVGVNAELEQNGVLSEPFASAQELFEPFRAKAKYPELFAVVFPHIWKAAAGRSGSADAALLSLATPAELHDIFEKGNYVDEDTLRRRKEWCAFYEDPETGIVHFEYDKAKCASLGLSEEYGAITEVQGTTAYRGRATGRARIVNSTADMEGFREGDIVVSYNTNPSLMPVLRKCAGIVTDEGGIMCHAAIISRELKKPCVIGTKIATKVIKDGDMVEVDATNGIVRILPS